MFSTRLACWSTNPADSPPDLDRERRIEIPHVSDQVQTRLRVGVLRRHDVNAPGVVAQGLRGRDGVHVGQVFEIGDVTFEIDKCLARIIGRCLDGYLYRRRPVSGELVFDGVGDLTRRCLFRQYVGVNAGEPYAEEG